MLILMAKTKSRSVKRQISANLITYLRVEPLLIGADLKAIGFKPGPIYKKILDRLLDVCLNGQVRTESEERELVRGMAKGDQSGSENCTGISAIPGSGDLPGLSGS